MKTANRRRLEAPLGGDGAEMVTGPRVKEKPLRPHECRTHLRKAVAAAYRDIVAGFVLEATGGGCQHLRMATEIVESKKRVRKVVRPKSVTAQLLEELDREFPD
jgi:hypothetical protein